MRALIAGFVFTLMLLASPMASAQDWQAAFDQWAATHPKAANDYDKARKQAEENEKNLKDISDKAFQSSFDNVFGADNFKPSEAVDLLKAVEAASGGDYKMAGETAGGFVISKFAPGLGQYIELMKATAKGIKMAEAAWVEGLYETKAYENASRIISSQPMSGPDTYVPSYLLMFLRNNPAYGGKIETIYQNMRNRESAMYNQWAADEAAVDQMLLPGWAGRWRSALGKDPTPRQMFNTFLYKITTVDRSRYMERFQTYYLEPMMEREARAQKRKYNAAMNAAVAKIVRETSGVSQACKDTSARLKEIGDDFTENYPKVLAQIETALTNAKAALAQEKTGAEVARDKIYAARKAERKALDDELEQVNLRKENRKKAYDKLDSWKAQIQSERARLQAAKDDPGYSSWVQSFNDNVRSYNSYKHDAAAASARLDARLDAYNQSVKEYNAMVKANPVKELIKADPVIKAYLGHASAVRKLEDMMPKVREKKYTCRSPLKAIRSGNLVGMIGADINAMDARCAHLLEISKEGRALQEKYKAECKTKQTAAN